MSSFKMWAGILSAAVLPLLLTACDNEAPPVSETVRSIQTITVTEPATGRMRRFSGVIEAANTASVSFEVSGVVQEINVNVGDPIQKGQVLAVLDAREHELNVKAARAAVGMAEVQLDHARADLSRLRRVANINAGAISLRDLEQAEATYNGAKNNLDYSTSRLNLAKRDLENIQLRAPFDGIVAARHVDAFQQIGRGAEVFTVNMEGALEAAVSVPESEIGLIYLGLPGEVRLPSLPGRVFDGIVTEVSRVAGTANAFPIKLTLEDDDPNIRPGNTAEVTLLLAGNSEEAGYLVPIGAVTSAGTADESFVFVFDADSSTVVRTPVITNGFRDSSVIVSEGLKAGDIVASAGVSFLRDGQEVRLLRRNTL